MATTKKAEDTTTWMRVPAAAKYACVSEWTIRQAVMDGDLPAYPIGKGKHYTLNRNDIDTWRMSRSYEPPSERHA